MTFGIEKKLSDDLSLSARGTWRNLIRTIDDVGVQVPNAEGSFDEVYYITNPGYGFSRPISQGGPDGATISGPTRKPRETIKP